MNFFASIDCRKSEHLIFLAIDKKFESLGHLFNDKIKVILIKSRRYKLDPFYKYKVLKQLNHEGFETTINVSVDRGMFSDEIALGCNSKNKIAIQRESNFLSSCFTMKNNKGYSKMIDFDSSNEFDKLEELKIYLSNKYRVEFYNDRKTLRTALDDGHIVIAPFASQKIKSWPIDKYSELIKNAAGLRKVILLGDAKQYENRLNSPKGINVINLIAKTSLKEADEIIQRAALFIGNDSGLTHLAYHHKIPLIAIIGGGSYGKFFPHGDGATNVFLYDSRDCFNCKWKCKYSEAFCLTNVSVSTVFQIAKRMLFL
jgi:ADP-heptose:LPS heptosyltransferase